MSKAFGRLIFVVLIWSWALVYFLECAEFDNSSEKITIEVAFWIFSFFVVIELFLAGKSLLACLKSEGFRTPELMVTRLLADSKFRIVTILIIYLVLIPRVGFYASSFAAFCCFSWALGTKGVFHVVVPGAILMITIYLIFNRALNLYLPSGMLF